jgi:hypothetical protein
MPAAFDRPSSVPSALALVALLAGCDIPTALPVIESRWSIPVDRDSLSVGQVLPAGVTVADGGFAVSAAPSDVSASLGVLCGAPCGGADGIVAPKPAFTGTFATTVALPEQLVEARLAPGGTIRVRLDNGFGFDPLRPAADPAAARGRIVIAARSAGEELTADTLDGAEVALPAGASLERTLSLPAGAAVGGEVFVTVEVASPAGDATTIRSADALTAAATPVSVLAAEASVVVRDRAVALATAGSDFDGIDEEVRSRVKDGVLRLGLDNALGVAGAFTLTFVRSETDEPLLEPHTLTLTGAATDSTDVELAESDVRLLLEAGRIRLAVDGIVSGSAPGQVVTVTPATTLRIAPRLLLRVRTED